eukprot:scaffold10946_cov114-Isochrysis_galbana.AAC.4
MGSQKVAHAQRGHACHLRAVVSAVPIKHRPRHVVLVNLQKGLGEGSPRGGVMGRSSRAPGERVCPHLEHKVGVLVLGIQGLAAARVGVRVVHRLNTRAGERRRRRQLCRRDCAAAVGGDRPHLPSPSTAQWRRGERTRR